MIDRGPRMKIAARGLRVLAALAVMATAWFGAATSVSAHLVALNSVSIGADTCDGSGSCHHEIGATFTVTTEDGEFLGACTLEGDPSAPIVLGCSVRVPPGSTVIVSEDVSTITPGTAPVENPLSFDTNVSTVASFNGVVFRNMPREGNVSTSQAPKAPRANNSQTSNIAIVTTELEQPAYDACYVLIGFSQIGCDENRDGRVMFADVPWGTYTVHQTADLGPGRWVEDFTIHVDGTLSAAGTANFAATIMNDGSGSSRSASSGSQAPTASSGSSGSLDIALITRDPRDGHLLTGACYVLVGFSNVGCDEDGDGQVTFAAIPYGRYTVHQTRTPAGYPAINDYAINVQPFHGLSEDYAIPVGYVVKQAPEQNAHGTRTVSFVFVDSRAFTKIVPARVCLKIDDVSKAGCDEDLKDGQIDFLDVPTGTHPLTFNNLPDGWQIVGDDRTGPTATIESGPDPQIVYIGVYTGKGSTNAGTGSGNGSGGGSGGASAASGSAGSTTTSKPNTSKAATLLMTFRACPDGFDPANGDFRAACTIPLDAPDAAIISWGGDGQGGMNITGLDRQDNGAYVYTADPTTMNIQLSGLAPVLRNAYQVVGADGMNGASYSVNLANGETREVFIFYYYE